MSIYYSGNFKITKREIIASISIVAVMIIVGILISEKISEYEMSRNEIYNKAVKINSPEVFQYGIITGLGNAFVYGDLKAVDTVTYPEIGGEYMYVKKVKQKYTMHTRVVTYTTGSGKNRQTHTRTETYWTWDTVDTDHIKCNEISFCGNVFDSDKINFPGSTHITTIKESSHLRYKYYGVSNDHKGTIFTELRNDTISDNTNFYDDMTIDETIDYVKNSENGEIIFWFIWSIFIVGCVYLFYYLENDWLE